MITNLKRLSIAIASAAIVLSLTSCASFSVSDNTKEHGKNAVCAVGGSLVSEIKTSDSTAKLVASLVKDNSTGDIKKIAENIIDGKGGQKAANQLSDYVDSLCN